MLCRADRGRYSNMVEDFHNYFTKGNNDYPSDTTEAYNRLVNYNTTYSNPAIRLVDDSEEALFSNVRGSKGGSNS